MWEENEKTEWTTTKSSLVYVSRPCVRNHCCYIVTPIRCYYKILMIADFKTRVILSTLLNPYSGNIFIKPNLLQHYHLGTKLSKYRNTLFSGLPIVNERERGTKPFCVSLLSGDVRSFSRMWSLVWESRWKRTWKDGVFHTLLFTNTKFGGWGTIKQYRWICLILPLFVGVLESNNDICIKKE